MSRSQSALGTWRKNEKLIKNYSGQKLSAESLQTLNTESPAEISYVKNENTFQFLGYARRCNRRARRYSRFNVRMYEQLEFISKLQGTELVHFVLSEKREVIFR